MNITTNGVWCLGLNMMVEVEKWLKSKFVYLLVAGCRKFEKDITTRNQCRFAKFLINFYVFLEIRYIGQCKFSWSPAVRTNFKLK